jgi:hypothetical protein
MAFQPTLKRNVVHSSDGHEAVVAENVEASDMAIRRSPLSPLPMRFITPWTPSTQNGERASCMTKERSRSHQGSHFSRTGPC